MMAALDELASAGTKEKGALEIKRGSDEKQSSEQAHTFTKKDAVHVDVVVSDD